MDFLGIFLGKFLDFSWIFLGGIFWEEFFGRIFLGASFLEDFFVKDLFRRIFWRNSLLILLKSANLFESERD